MDTIEDKLASAIQLIKTGARDEGANILANLVQLQPNLLDAWLWLYVCYQTKERRDICLRMALRINPDSDEIIKSLDEIIDSVMTAKGGLLPQTPPQTNEDKGVIKNNKVSQNPSRSGNESLPRKTNVVTEKRIQKKKKVRKSLQAGHSRKDEAHQDLKSKEREGDDQIPYVNSPPPYVAPTIVIVRPEDNLFAENNWKRGKFSRLDAGIFGKTLFVDEIRINAFNLPKCLEAGRILDDYRCDICDFFSAKDCVFIDDPYLFEEASLFIARRQHRFEENEKRKKAIINVLFTELRAHGRPLHYSVLAQIVKKRHPRLGITERSAMMIMTHYPKIFENLGDGVFQYKR